MIFGYARVSTDKQNIDRQIRNILALNSSAKIYQEHFTGTKTTGRHEFQKLLNKVVPGDTIIFDSVSRMSRNAEEGFALYKKMFDDGVNLVFINEPYINTDVYKGTRDSLIPMTNTDIDLILTGINKYLMKLAEEQIRLAFEQAQKERDDLSKRTRQGIETARLNGKKPGRAKGTIIHTTKSEKCKKKIKEYSKLFGGSLSDKDLIALLHINRSTYYKYKNELKEDFLMN